MFGASRYACSLMARRVGALAATRSFQAASMFGPSAMSKLRDILEEYSANNFHQGLPTNFMSEIIEETHETEDGLVPADAAMRALTNLKSSKSPLTEKDAWDILHQELHVKTENDVISQERFNALFYDNVTHPTRSQQAAPAGPSATNQTMVSHATQSDSPAMDKLRDILEEYSANNFHQGLPTNFMTEIIEETHEAEDGMVPAHAAMRALTKLKSKNPLKKEEAWDILQSEFKVQSEHDLISQEAFNALFYDNVKRPTRSQHAASGSSATNQEVVSHTTLSGAPAMNKLRGILQEYSANNFHQGLPTNFMTLIIEETHETEDGMVSADAAMRALTKLETSKKPLTEDEAWGILQSEFKVQSERDLISREQFDALFYDNVKVAEQAHKGASKPPMDKLRDILGEYSTKNFNQGLPSGFMTEILLNMPDANEEGMVPADAAIRALMNLRSSQNRLTKSDAWDILRQELHVETVNNLVSQEKVFAIFYGNVKAPGKK